VQVVERTPLDALAVDDVLPIVAAMLDAEPAAVATGSDDEE
jgi:hypothetical protein